jgi:protoheme ferro-lyase
LTSEAFQGVLSPRQNFNIVSQTAKVTLGWLYKQPELVERIRTLMKQQEKVVELPPLQCRSSTSSSQLLDNLKQRIREQDSEIKQLKKQLAVWGGLIRQQAETIEHLNNRLGEKT